MAVRIAPFHSLDRIVVALSDFDDPTTGREVRPVVRGPADPDEVGPATYDFSGTTWKRLTFALEVTLPTAEIRRVLPPELDVMQHIAFVASIRCQGTKLRQAVKLRSNGDGVWAGHATLTREDLRGTVLIRPSVAVIGGWGGRAVVSGSPLRPGSVIGTGDPVRLIVDNESMPANEPLIISGWEDFSASSNAWRRDHPSSLFHLEPTSPRPRLYLNSRYPELREILNSEASTGPEAAVRNLVASLIADSVWLQLGLMSAAAVTLGEADEGATAPTTEWKRLVVERLADEAYLGEGDKEQAIQRLATDVHDRTGSEALISKIGTLSQEWATTPRIVDEIVRARETMSVGRDNGE